MSEKPHHHFAPIKLIPSGDKQYFEIPAGYKAKISLCNIGHITGSVTAINLLKIPYDGFSFAIVEIAAAVASGNYRLNDRVLTNFTHVVDTLSSWLPEGWVIRFGGGTGASIRMLLELVPIEAET